MSASCPSLAMVEGSLLTNIHKFVHYETPWACQKKVVLNKKSRKAYPVMPSKFIADGLVTGSEDAVKLFSANQHQMNSTVIRVGTKANITPWVGASDTM